jgi:hypothetical protein
MPSSGLSGLLLSHIRAANFFRIPIFLRIGIPLFWIWPSFFVLAIFFARFGGARFHLPVIDGLLINFVLVVLFNIEQIDTVVLENETAV